MAKAKAIPAPEDDDKRPPAKPPNGMIFIPGVSQIEVPCRIVGTAPLICHAIPKKFMQEMIDRGKADSTPGTKVKKSGRAARDYEQEFRESLYPLDDGSGYGFPAIAFKHALVDATRLVNDLDMKKAKRLFFVLPDATSRGMGMVRINGKPEMEECFVRLKSGMGDKPPDYRVRGQFRKWSAVIRVQYLDFIINERSVLNLMQLAGICQGIGENRPSSPEKSGDHGTWQLQEGKIR